MPWLSRNDESEVDLDFILFEKIRLRSKDPFKLSVNRRLREIICYLEEIDDQFRDYIDYPLIEQMF